jgi:hypothetical protein
MIINCNLFIMYRSKVAIMPFITFKILLQVPHKRQHMFKAPSCSVTEGRWQRKTSNLHNYILQPNILMSLKVFLLHQQHPPQWCFSSLLLAWLILANVELICYQYVYNSGKTGSLVLSSLKNSQLSMCFYQKSTSSDLLLHCFLLLLKRAT